MYHTAGYHTYSESSGEGTAFLALAVEPDRGLAWPYLLRRISDVEGFEGCESTDVTSVYGYAGPLAWGCSPGDDFLERAWTAILGVWHEQGAVASFTRFHPLLENAALATGMRGPCDRPSDPAAVGAMGRTVSIDLTASEETIRAGYSESLRRQIRNYRRAGQTTIDDVGWSDLPAFVRLYHETMTRNDADPYYYFDLEDFARLREGLGQHVHLLVTRIGDEVGAAGIFTEYDGLVQEHLMAANPAFASVSPYKVQLDDAAMWAKARGNRVLHLGGGRGAREDSLFEFKRRFSTRRHEFYTGRWVLDRTRYDSLVLDRRAAVGDRGSLSPDYFPAYRAQVVAA